MLRSLFKLSFMTLLSRIMGFIRDVCMADVFGTGTLTDAFFIAFRLPNFFRKVFAEGAFLQVIVPYFAHMKVHDRENLKLFIAEITGALIVIIAVLILFVMMFANDIVSIIAPGFHNNFHISLIINMIYITFPYIIFISLVSFFSSILNSYNSFVAPGLMPILLNISFIIFTYYHQYFHPNIMSLSWAVLFGGISQLLSITFVLYKYNLFVLPKINLYSKYVRKVCKEILPSLLTTSVAQVSLLLNIFFASFLVPGSLSWIYYADRLMEFPVGIIGVTVSTVMLSKLSHAYVNQYTTDFYNIFTKGIIITLLFLFPVMTGLFVLAKPIIITLFMHGKFLLNDVNKVTILLKIYAIGILGFVVVKVLNTVFYSVGNIKTPVRISLIILIFNILVNILLISAIHYIALVLSVSLGALLNLVLLLIQLKLNKLISAFNIKEFLFNILKILFATLGMLFFLLITKYYFL